MYISPAYVLTSCGGTGLRDSRASYRAIAAETGGPGPDIGPNGRGVFSVAVHPLLLHKDGLSSSVLRVTGRIPIPASRLDPKRILFCFFFSLGQPSSDSRP